MCCLGLTLLQHLFLQGGGERAASRSTNQGAGLLRRTSVGSADERALPRDTEPLLRPILTNFFNILFYYLLSLFSPFAHCFCYFCAIHHCYSPFLSVPCPTIPPSPSSHPQRPVKTSCHYVCQRPCSLCERAAATWRSLKVHVPNSASLFLSYIPQLCCVELEFNFAFAGCFHSGWELKIKWLVMFKCWKCHLSSLHLLNDTALLC